MKFQKNKQNKNEILITVTLQFKAYCTDDEFEDGEQLNHKMIAEGCNKKLSTQDYDVQVD